jgi:hypothetical protein
MEEKILFFDTGPIISLVMSRLVWILPELKKKFGGRFYITPSVQRELIERPLEVKRFEFEALQVMKLIKDGVLEIYDNVPKKQCSQLLDLANQSFKINNNYIDIIQSGEIESVVCALQTDAQAIVMDERTLRVMVEDINNLKHLLERRFNSEVAPNNDNLKRFSLQVKGIKIIRSIELISVAYKMGLLNDYLPAPGGKEVLVDSVLWAAKYNGCAVTDEEVEQIKGYLIRK